MVRKKLAVAVAAIGALQANLASALGLGDITLHSALNQPLNAEIKLLNTRDLDESQLRIRLATQDEFQHAGVSRDYFLTNIKFKVELDHHGGGVIKLTTRDPVVEPYLDFLVEARWPTGRMLREFTVLLDLPNFSGSGADQVKAASASSSAQAQAAPAPVKTEASVAAMTHGNGARETLREGALKAGEKYRVRRDDTLWEIAAKSRPNRKVSVQQTMVGIQRLNPEAFMGGNINRLKAGYVLRLPTEAEITGVSGHDAVREVAQQNRAWRTGSSEAANTGGAQLDATSTAADNGAGYSEKARLSIAAGGESAAGNAGEGSGSGSEALQNKLDSSMETLDKTKRENSELKGRLNDMEAKIATLQRLLQLKDDQLAALQGTEAEQQKSTEAGQAPEQAATAPTTAESSAETATTAEAASGEAETPTAMGGQSAETSPEAATEQAATATTEPAKPTPAPAPAPKPAPAPAPQPGLVDQLLANPLYAAGGGGLIVVALAALLVMRKRKAAEEAEEVELGLFDEGDEELSDIAFDTEESELPEEEAPDNADLLAAELESEIAADNAEEAAEEESSTVVQSETGDAIAEADIYIAYGRYQQAIDLLSTAISQEPGRSDLRVKLLEVYVETRDKPDFQRHYVELQGLGDDAAVNQVKEMLSSVDGVADWLDDLPGAVGEDFSDADMDADLIDSDEEVAAGLDDDLEIDLDLDDSLGATQENPAISESDLDLEGDLNLEDELDLDGDLDLDSDLDLDLDLNETEETSTAATGVFEAVAPEESAAEELDLGEDLSLEEDLSLGEDLSLDEEELDLGEDLDLGLDSLDSEESSGDTLDLGDLSTELEATPESDTGELDLGDLDLGDLDTAEPEALAEEPVAEEAAAAEEGFDLDLESDSDLDLDLGDLGETDLTDLEAEFGAGTEEEPLQEAGDLDVNLDVAESMADDVDLDDLDLSNNETVTLDTGDTDFDFDGDLGGDLESELGDLELPEESDKTVIAEPPAMETPEPEAPAAEPVAQAAAPASGGDDEFDFLADADEVATKLDLARAYIDMGDTEGARDILDEVMQEGNDEQKQEANELLERV